ncbi:rhodanese-like domain-containing protein [Clostridium sp. 1001271B_151109_B4]|uniref:rhodanese-like domain-containing protein n=1 Tax=Clostridium sp. 1001271B_151109_B4 TaxID=2787148 RepID=UPI0018AABE76|nr:rhodanese-like domain-containing protein [Clostridium sp. 1001271B_151109_B4]
MSSFRSINSNEAKNLIETCNELVIIDVRRFSEYKSEKIPNAVNIPVEELEWEIEELKENIDKPILVYCKAGHKSALACQMLEEEGFSKIYNLGQGILGYDGKIV